MSFQNIFFFNCVELSGGTILIFFQYKQPKIELVDRKLTQKLTLFARLKPVFWPFCGVEIFVSFLKLFWSFSGSLDLGIVFEL